MLFWLLLGFLGVGAGAYGALVGTGAGFLIAPVLLLLYPQASTELVASISLAVVSLNALSASLSYALQRRIDYRAALLFASAAVPAAVIGAFVSHVFPRRPFDITFGVVLLLAAGYLWPRSKTSAISPGWRPGYRVHRLKDRQGNSYIYAFSSKLGRLLSLGIGFLSSLLGIGGGILHVPILIRILRFPTAVAIPTSLFVVAATALAGVGVHLAAGEYSEGWRRTLALGIGVVIGAQLGGRLSTRIRGTTVLRLFCLGMAGVAIRLLVKGIGG